MAKFTSEQVTALAPDAASAKAGKDLAVPRKWVTLGRDGVAAWGQCQGSGKQPYQTQVALGEIAFKCSCPSRKFPCKHGLGLLLLLAGQEELFTEKEQPAWVAEWLTGRSQRAEKSKEHKAKEHSAETKPKSTDATAQEKRAQSREKKVQAGLQELEIWLHDLVRGGLAAAQSQPYAYWDGIAARMIDAQAPGVARMIREMAGASAWSSAKKVTNSATHLLETREGEMLWRLGKLHLLLQGFAHRDELSAEMQAEVRTQIGWTQSQEELLAQPGVRDVWKVLSSRVEEEERLRVSRTWLWGEKSGRFALVLHFAHGSAPLATPLFPGTEIEAEVNFFPSAFPLRTIVKERFQETQAFSDSPPGVTITEAIDRYVEAAATHPWLGAFPVMLRHAMPITRDEGVSWTLRDVTTEVTTEVPTADDDSSGAADSSGVQDSSRSHEIPIAANFPNGWRLLALSGGYPLPIFGEWDGRNFLPLAVMTELRWVRL